MSQPRLLTTGALALSLTLALASCQPSAVPVTAGVACQDFGQSSAGATITRAELIPGGRDKPNGAALPLPAHCLIQGKVNERVSPVDGKTYAISFELRLPTLWNGRFFYQANGGNDGALVPAYGNVLGGGADTNALTQGFAVLSSDGGHRAEDVPGVGGQLFGLDPQARLDYGYNAVGVLAPLAKTLIGRYYGTQPRRSYLVGCSNGGRVGMVAATRYPQMFDGILAAAPGFNLPKAAVAQMWDVQSFAAAAPRDAQGRPNLGAAFTPEDLALVSRTLLDKADALDGLKDGIIMNTRAAQGAFSVQRDLPTLSQAQRDALERVFGGPKNSAGQSLYSDWSYDPGLSAPGWRTWKLNAGPGPSLAVTLGAPSMAYIFTTPPTPLTAEGLFDYALNFNFDTDAPKIYATDATYTESAMGFMTPPNPTDLSALAARGGRLLVMHGVSDPVFSVNDTTRWYEAVQARGGEVASSAALFTVPGMTHCSGGPATDQMDLLTPLVNWVERGVRPESILGTARGPGALTVNAAVPAEWAPNRTRPLCAYPKVATYRGEGDPERAESFTCQAP